MAHLHSAICKIPVHASRCNPVASSGTQLTSPSGPLTHSLGLVCELGLGILHRGPLGAVYLPTQPWTQPASSKVLLNELFGEEKLNSPRGFNFIFSLQKSVRAHNSSFTLYLNLKEQVGIQHLPQESSGQWQEVLRQYSTLPQKTSMAGCVKPIHVSLNLDYFFSNTFILKRIRFFSSVSLSSLSHFFFNKLAFYLSSKHHFLIRKTLKRNKFPCTSRGHLDKALLLCFKQWVGGAEHEELVNNRAHRIWVIHWRPHASKWQRDAQSSSPEPSLLAPAQLPSGSCRLVKDSWAGVLTSSLEIEHELGFH